jgi:capsular polysaccharide biosynthesis protein
MVISGVIGFILAFIMLLLRSLLDTGIHDEMDVKNFIDYPILGSIPIMGSDNENDKNSNKGERK